MEGDSTLFDPPKGSLARSVGRGALATGGAQAIRLACQFVSVIALSRLLAPDDFGIVAMAGPVLAFIGLFQDLGLMQATIQKKSITQGEVNALFWINIGVSVLLMGALILIAPLAAQFYGEPAVGTLIVAMSVLTVVHAAAGQHHAILNRRMLFGRTAVVNSAAAVVGLAVSIAWAMADPSYWALYAGTVATALTGTVTIWVISGWKPNVPRLVPGTGTLVRFGTGLTGYNFTSYFSRNFDIILIGRYWGEQQLGLYDRAQKLLLFPLQQVTGPLGAVTVPALSRMRDQPHRYRHAYARVASIILMITLPGVAVAIAMADVLVPFALGEQWRGSALIFQALGFAGLMQSLNSSSGWLFISQGRSMELMRWGVVSATISVTAFVIGLPYGAFGVAMAYAVSEYLRTPLLWLYVGRKGPVRTRDVTRMGLPFLLGAHLALGTILIIKPHLPQQPIPALILAAMLSYLLVASFAALFPAGRQALNEVRVLLSQRMPLLAKGRRA